MKLDFTPGSLVTVRDRPWIVLPSDNQDLLLLKPLGGTEDEITGIYKPLANASDLPTSYNFVKPSERDLGDFNSAKLLFNAARLSFRNAAGPFRCLGKLSFRPRSYQMVPLIMALKQEVVRLLIADDVGVGKTIEALLIAKELYERKEINGFAIVCLPHLCDQWQDELKSKFGIEAEIVRSGTITALQQKIRANENIFKAFPFLIVSIDFIKTGTKREVFIQNCPDFIIVDEAHTCAKPSGGNASQQLRYHLLHKLAKNKNQHLVLLTATPHSGKQEEFQSILGLLNPEFEKTDLVESEEKDKEAIAKHFVQRRRKDVLTWLGEETTFPDRETIDKDYKVGDDYAEVFDDILDYAREVVAATHNNQKKQRYSYWDVLALLRGVMSSPAAGISMLEKKAAKKKIVDVEDEEILGEEDRPESDEVMDLDFGQNDSLPLSVLSKGALVENQESKRLLTYASRLKNLFGIEKDQKAKEALAQVKTFIDQGYNPIIFCRYIQTANYLGHTLKDALKTKSYKSLHIEIVTSELDDELRREKISEMAKSERRLLVATDCLSEGINLQEGFNAVLHYDLPWNPNRLEQREGRIDRFGQKTKSVKVALLYGSNNPMDGVVLEVLLKKAREIRKSIGISVPFPENSSSVMQAVTQAFLLKPTVSVKQISHQLSMFEAEEISAEKNRVAKAFEAAEEREKLSRTVFAQKGIKIGEIESDLKEIDDAIGDVRSVEDFVISSLRFIGVQVEQRAEGYKIYTLNIPARLKESLTEKNDLLVSFKSPTPYGYRYLGRNHPFTERLCQFILNNALEGLKDSAARAAVLRSRDVDKKTVLFQFRVRNVIAEQPTNKEIVAEEMWLWGYTGDIADENWLAHDKSKSLLMNSKITANIELGEQSYWLKEEMSWVQNEQIFRKNTDKVALERANHLVELHTKVRKLVSGNRYKVVEPVLPMDVLGIYIFLPDIG